MPWCRLASSEIALMDAADQANGSGSNDTHDQDRDEHGSEVDMKAGDTIRGKPAKGVGLSQGNPEDGLKQEFARIPAPRQAQLAAPCTQGFLDHPTKAEDDRHRKPE